LIFPNVSDTVELH